MGRDPSARGDGQIRLDGGRQTDPSGGWETDTIHPTEDQAASQVKNARPRE